MLWVRVQSTQILGVEGFFLAIRPMAWGIYVPRGFTRSNNEYLAQTMFLPL